MWVGMRRMWSATAGLLAVVLLLATAGCSEGGQSVVAEYNYPCGPFWDRFEAGHQELFLEWTPDGNQLVFNYVPVEFLPDQYGFLRGQGIWAADSEGRWVHMLVDANPGHAARFSFHADVSPDGTRIVYSTCEFSTESIDIDPEYEFERKRFRYEIATINLDGTGKLRLTENEHLDHYPVWSPDGSSIAFIANPRGRGNVHLVELYTMAADGSDTRLAASTLIREGTDTEGFYYWRTNAFYTVRGEKDKDSKEAWLGAQTFSPPVWSPDGERLAFLVNEGQRLPYRHILYSVRADGSEMTRIGETIGVPSPPQLPQRIFIPLVLPSWSPDGEFLAFVMANEEGKSAGVYTVRPNGSDLEQLLKPHGPEWKASHLSWSPDGAEILVASQQGLHFVQLDGSGLRTVDQKAPFNDYDYSTGIVVAWSPDGTRVALYMPGDAYRNIPPQLYTIARDGTDRRDLIRLDDGGNISPANPPQDES